MAGIDLSKSFAHQNPSFAGLLKEYSVCGWDDWMVRIAVRSGCNKRKC